ncbi:hypothetical protein GCM10027447_30830 [Glycomyces halotolerans]
MSHFKGTTVATEALPRQTWGSASGNIRTGHGVAHCEPPRFGVMGGAAEKAGSVFPGKCSRKCRGTWATEC